MIKSHVVSAPARLHFGLFSIGNSLEYQFGGCGLMIDGPRTNVTSCRAEQLSIVGAEPETVRSTLKHWFNGYQSIFRSIGVDCIEQLPLSLHVDQVASRHSGFGSGTQLAMAVVTAAFKCLDLPTPNSQDLAIATGRGRRSAIGSHGFLQGGFLIDRGKKEGDSLAPLELQLEFPTNWPIVTVLPGNAQGLSGNCESSAFQNLPSSSAEHRRQMIQLVKNQMVSSIIDHNYVGFAQALYEFGNRSGSMFKSLQGGAYNGPEVTKTVDIIRSAGIEAVGQSSWGPCVFAILENQQQADSLVDRLAAVLPADTKIAIRRADNQGAILSTEYSKRAN